MSFNLATILTEATLAAPDAPACRFAGTTTTYRELDELSGRCAAGLLAAGLRPGQVVAMQLPNIPHFLIAYFGYVYPLKGIETLLAAFSLIAKRDARARLVIIGGINETAVKSLDRRRG